MISASTVAIGFLALLTVPISEIRSIGVAGFLVTAMSVLLTNTLVPAALVLLGPRIRILAECPLLQSWMRSGPRVRGIAAAAMGKDDCHTSLACLFVAGLPLLLLAWQVRRLDTSLPREIASASGGISPCAATPLNRWIGAALLNRCAYIVELPTDSIAQPTGWDALDGCTKRLASDPRCDRVISITTIAESNRSSLPDLSRETRERF